MKNHGQLLAVGAVAIGLLTVTDSTEAAFPWFRGPSPAAAIPPTSYAPQTPRYVVVSPTPPTAAGGAVVAGAAGTWDERQLPAPAYPWGWFGSRGHAQPWSHRRYYDNMRDHALIRSQ